jgi:hypothetical protein
LGACSRHDSHRRAGLFRIDTCLIASRQNLTRLSWIN